MSKSNHVAAVCKLCRKSAKLCKSHIISDFAYRSVFDETNRMAAVSISGKDWELQNGTWEYMLCLECETRFSRWEEYFAKEWTKADRVPARFTRESTIQIVGLNYALFKLFHLSILWRFGASTRPEYTGIKLGPHQDRIAQMLLNDDPGPSDSYPIWAHVLFAKEKRIATDIVVPPCEIRTNAARFYVVVFCGCAWYYCVSSHDPGDTLLPNTCRLTSDGDLFLTAIDSHSYPPIKRILNGYLANPPARRL